MGVSKLQGTPWHIENLSKNDDRRHKAWCIYYKNGNCSHYNYKCPGSKNCTKYKYNENHEKKKVVTKGKYTLYNYYEYKYLRGKFTLEYEDGERETYTIGDNIQRNAPILEKIIQLKYRDEFEFNGEKIKLISKKISYTPEAQKRQNYLSVKILSNKDLSSTCINNTGLRMLKFKIKFLSNNKVAFYNAGHSIRWDDPLIKKIIETKSGSKFQYKNEDLLLVSKYVKEER